MAPIMSLMLHLCFTGNVAYLIGYIVTAFAYGGISVFVLERLMIRHIKMRAGVSVRNAYHFAAWRWVLCAAILGLLEASLW